jgi:hypothetical protein
LSITGQNEVVDLLLTIVPIFYNSRTELKITDK